MQEADEFYRSVTPPSVSPDAAWDLAFHTLPLAIVDPEFAKEQMELLLRGVYVHRSAPLPTGGHLEQADGTAWMYLFSQNMAELAMELAVHSPTYEDMVMKFAEHFYYIAAAMNRPWQDGM